MSKASVCKSLSRSNKILRVNCKLHPWSLGLTGFYTPKFQKLDFTPCSLILLAIHTPRLVFSVRWHICMLMCFIFAKSAPKLRRFNDDQAKSWHASKLHSFKPKLNFLHISINDTVWSKVLKPKNKDTRTTQGSHHSHEPKPFILGGGGVEGSRQPRRWRLDPLALIARVKPNKPNPNPMNPSALVNPGSLGDCGFLGFVVLSHYAVFLLFMYLMSNFFTWVGFIFILLYCFGIDIGHCSLGHWIFFVLLFLTIVNIHEYFFVLLFLTVEKSSSSLFGFTVDVAA